VSIFGTARQEMPGHKLVNLGFFSFEITPRFCGMNWRMRFVVSFTLPWPHKLAIIEKGASVSAPFSVSSLVPDKRVKIKIVGKPRSFCPWIA
jgi:hypothetical protein